MIVSFTPVKTEPDILELHLASLGEQCVDGHIFYDDNDDPVSSEMLADWAAERENASILPTLDDLPSAGGYDTSGDKHEWSWSSVSRVATIKNAAIAAFLQTDAEHLVFIDADVVPAPVSMLHLVDVDLPIVCGVYWTRWYDEGSGLEGYGPNVWDQHPTKYLHPMKRFLEPGHYEVGGLGAFTAVKREVLEPGFVNFNAVQGVGYFGEDRHFCIRAAVFGIPLVACTHVVASHVYRPSDIEPTRKWWEEIT